MRFYKTIFFIFGMALFYPLCAAAQTSKEFVMTADKLADGKAVELHKQPWKYQSGDEALAAASDFDDSGWKTLTNDEINSNPQAALENWNGKAWFRLRLQVDEQLANQPLAWRVWHWGASEIYLDGKLVQSYGAISPGADVEFNPRGVFFPVVFKNGGAHTIAVRYSFKAAGDLTGGRGAWLMRAGYLPGFKLSIEPVENAGLKLENRLRENRLENIFVGLFLALALVHFLLYIFYRNAPSNLFYSLFVAGLALAFWLQILKGAEHTGAVPALLTDIVRLNVQSLAILSLLAFLYVEFIGRPSRYFWVLLGLWLISIFLHSAQLWREFPYTIVMLFLTLVDCVRLMVRALAGRRDGAWIIAVGVGLLAVGVINNISIERNFIEIAGWLYQLNLYITVLSVPLAVSIYLARNFARTNHRLEEQLAQVQELSDKQLENERREAELRLEHERTQAENERRARELDEARRLQLSMLPARVPQIPNLEIAAYMKPATEVGGDYYDFYVGEDGTLTVAVGDATGHGLKAGSIVTAAKSLFNAFAEESDVTKIFRQSSAALKKMNLRGLFMAMTMLKIKDNNLRISNAGMPSTLLYRSATKTVEEISIKAMPLGSMANFPYKEQEFALAAGDCVIVLSDGFPEMFNENDVIFGFDKAALILPGVANLSPQEIINHLVEAGEKWADGRPQDDDVTFVVIKVKGGSDGNL
jgi:serine phosphatase RsbU (regulator of sigma subunit)